MDEIATREFLGEGLQPSELSPSEGPSIHSVSSLSLPGSEDPSIHSYTSPGSHSSDSKDQNEDLGNAVVSSPIGGGGDPEEPTEAAACIQKRRRYGGSGEDEEWIPSPSQLQSVSTPPGLALAQRKGKGKQSARKTSQRNSEATTSHGSSRTKKRQRHTDPSEDEERSITQSKQSSTTHCKRSSKDRGGKGKQAAPTTRHAVSPAPSKKRRRHVDSTSQSKAEAAADLGSDDSILISYFDANSPPESEGAGMSNVPILCP